MSPSLVAMMLAAASHGSAQQPGWINGLILDAETGELISDATIGAVNDRGSPVASVVSDDQGRFSLEALPPGAYELLVGHVAYGTSNDTLTVAAGEVLTVEYRISARPIELAGISVTARVTTPEPRLARGTRVDGMTALEVDAVRPRISSVGDLLRIGNVPGLTVTDLGGQICVESNRARRSPPGQCNMVTVVIDDVMQVSPESSLALMSPEVIESWELLPALEAGTTFGGRSGSGVLQITTRSGTLTPQGFEGIAAMGQRWMLSAAFLATGSSTLHEGVLQVINATAGAGLTYIEKTNPSPGLELRGRWNSRSWGYLGASAYGSFGSSSAIYNFGTGRDITPERDYSSVGFDLWWGAPILRRGNWNGDLAIGPSFQWQSLQSAGHPNEIATPGSPDPPQVEWTDRNWFAPGGVFNLDFGYDFGLNSGVFLGLSVRVFSTAGTSTWAELDQEAIFEATGRTVEVSYDSGIATALGLRTGVRWYP